MKLYHSQYTRSGRARWTLEELGVPYELSRLSLREGQHKTPEYLDINPHGAVPSLVDGNLKLTESSAIMLHLADKFPDKHLAPAPGTDERAEYYRWMVYVPATMDPVLETLTVQLKFTPEDKRNQGLIDTAKKKLDHIAKVLTKAIGGRKHIVGDSFSAADIVVGSAIGWMGFIGVLGDYPELVAYHSGLAQRPAYQKANAD